MTTPPALQRWSGPVVVAGLLLTAWLAVALTQPPSPRGGEAPKAEFSVARAWSHIEEVARAPHPVGTAEHDRVRGYVVAELSALGLEVDTLTALSHVRWGNTVLGALTRNVAARLPGTASTGAVLLMSHYDAVPLSHGAGDAGIGVATVLESARALTSGERPRNDVVFLLTDGEELGLLGARAFAAEHPWMADIAFVLNFEGRGTTGPAVMFETGVGSGWAVRELARRGRRPVSTSILPEAYARMPNDTDFTVFRERGLAGLNFAIGGSAQWYHTPGDRPANLSAASVQHMGENGLALARRVGSMDLAAAEPDERVYFHVPGVGLLGYGPGWAIPLAALLVVALAGVTVYARRRGPRFWWSIPVGLLAAAATLAVSMLLAHWLWGAVRHGHAEWGAVVGRALHREWPYTLAVVAGTVAVVSSVFGLLRRWFSLPGLALGALLIPVAVAVATAFLLTPGSYLLLWPALLSLGMVALLAAGDDGGVDDGGVDDGRGDDGRADDDARTEGDGRAEGDGRTEGDGRADRAGWRGWGLGIAGAGVVLLMAPVVYLVHVMLSIAVAPLLAAVAGVLMVLLLPALDLLSRPSRAWLPVAALLAGAALVGVGVGLAGAGPTADRPAPSNLVHVQDAATGEAFWASPADHDDAFTARFVGGSPDTVRLGEYAAGLRAGPYRVAPAPAWAAPTVAVTVLESGTVDGGRRLRLRLEWDDPPMMVEVRPTSPGIGLHAPLPAARLDVPAPALGDGWRLGRAGLAEPLELVVSGPAGEPLGLMVTARYAGLPRADGLGIERPPGLMAVPAHRGFGTLSDVRLVREMLLLPADGPESGRREAAGAATGTR